ncbi:MAG: glycosyltransferase [Bacteroidia bacterium]|nr:glycosyltransferase [Bacteroidia bacterium]
MITFVNRTCLISPFIHFLYLASDMKRLLVLTSRFPYPLERGDKLRVYHQMRELSQSMEIYLFSTTDREVKPEERAALEAFCKEVHIHHVKPFDIALALIKGIFSRLPFQVHYFFRRSFHRFLLQEHARIQPDVVFCQLLRMAEYAEGMDGRKALDYMDTFSLGMQRRIGQSARWKRPLLAWEYRRLQRYERDIFPRFDQHCIISAQDRDALPLGDTSGVVVIPNGVDANFFQPKPTIRSDQDLVYVGNLGYFPNVQASKILAREILPGLGKPQKLLLLAGARPAAEVLQLGSDPAVSLTGWVEDIRDEYARGKVFAAPLFSGSGQQNKILEAMSMGLPCVVTDIVNKAIGGTHGQHLLLANSVPEFQEAIIQLLEEDGLRSRIGHAAREFVLATYDWKQVGDQLRRWLLVPDHPS